MQSRQAWKGMKGTPAQMRKMSATPKRRSRGAFGSIIRDVRVEEADPRLTSDIFTRFETKEQSGLDVNHVAARGDNCDTAFARL